MLKIEDGKKWWSGFFTIYIFFFSWKRGKNTLFFYESFLLNYLSKKRKFPGVCLIRWKLLKENRQSIDHLAIISKAYLQDIQLLPLGSVLS